MLLIHLHISEYNVADPSINIWLKCCGFIYRSLIMMLWIHIHIYGYITTVLSTDLWPWCCGSINRSLDLWLWCCRFIYRYLTIIMWIHLYLTLPSVPEAFVSSWIVTIWIYVRYIFLTSFNQLFQSENSCSWLVLSYGLPTFKFSGEIHNPEHQVGHLSFTTQVLVAWCIASTLFFYQKTTLLYFHWFPGNTQIHLKIYR